MKKPIAPQRLASRKLAKESSRSKSAAHQGSTVSRSRRTEAKLASSAPKGSLDITPKKSRVSAREAAGIPRSSSQHAKATASRTPQPGHAHRSKNAAATSAPGAKPHGANQGIGRARTGALREVMYAHVTKPEYPRQARTQGWEGTTVLRVLVDPEGKSEIVEIHRTSGFEALDEAAREALRTWRFHPARFGERPVASWVHIPIVFKLHP